MGQLWANGTLEMQATRGRPREGRRVAVARTGRLARAGHGVTVGILATRPDRLPRLRAPRDVFSFSSLRKGRLLSLSFDPETSDKSTSEISYFAMTRDTRHTVHFIAFAILDGCVITSGNNAIIIEELKNIRWYFLRQIYRLFFFTSLYIECFIAGTKYKPIYIY